MTNKHQLQKYVRVWDDYNVLHQQVIFVRMDGN